MAEQFKITTTHYVVIAVVIIIIILMVVFWDKIKSFFSSEPAKTTNTSNTGTGAPDFNKLLKKGSKGAEVKILQGWLGVTADGIFGPVTENALKTKKNVTEITLNQYAGATNGTGAGSAAAAAGAAAATDSWWNEMSPTLDYWSSLFGYQSNNSTVLTTTENEINWQA